MEIHRPISITRSIQYDRIKNAFVFAQTFQLNLKRQHTLNIVIYVTLILCIHKSFFFAIFFLNVFFFIPVKWREWKWAIYWNLLLLLTFMCVRMKINWKYAKTINKYIVFNVTENIYLINFFILTMTDKNVVCGF